MKQKKSKSPLLLAAEVLCFAFMALLVILLIRKFAPDLVTALKSGSNTDIESLLKKSNSVDSILFVVLLQVVQVVSIVLPGMPIHIAAGVSLGLRTSFLCCYGGFLLANAAVFRVVRFAGAPIHRFFENLGQKHKKIGTAYDHLTRAKNPVVVIVAANLLPFVPNGIIPYAAAQTGISDWKFWLATALGSALPTFADCCVGSLVLSGNKLIAAAIFAARLLLSGVLLYHQDRLNAHMEKQA